MKPRQPLDVVVDVLKDQEQAWMRRFGEVERAYRRAANRCRELESYRIGYLQDIARLTHTDPRRLQEMHAFVAKLASAIQQQQGVVQRARQDRDALRARWLESRRKTRSVSKVALRRQREAVRDAERREQKESDDRSQRSRGRR